MFKWDSAAEWMQMFRYYQAGVVNTIFGYGIFAALLVLGMNVYVAQIMAHMIGVAFNYVTYSFYAFRGHKPTRSRFLGSYVINYGLSLAALATLSHFGVSPYLAGLGSIVIASFANYFVLKLFVYDKSAV